MRIVVCVHLALALTTVSLIVQGIRATLVGRVTVESGAVIPNSKIKLVNTATGDTRDARSNGTGDFALPQLPPGDYVLTIEQAGFSTDVRRGTVLETGQEARLDIILKAGAHTQEVQEVNVSATAPLVSSENATVAAQCVCARSGIESRFPRRLQRCRQ